MLLYPESEGVFRRTLQSTCFISNVEDDMESRYGETFHTWSKIQ